MHLFLPIISLLLLISSLLPPSTSYQLKAVRFEGRCQLWYNNDQGWNSRRVQVYFFYDPAPFLVARSWRTQRKFVFIHPENKQLFQLNQNSINRARSICNVEESAMEIPLANQTIYSNNGYYSNWQQRFNRFNSNNAGRETFDDSQFRQNQVARFLNPNGTDQFYQVWRDRSNKGQCKASLVFETVNDLNTAGRMSNQISYPSRELRSRRTYPLYNCLIASYSCRTYHVFLVNEDSMDVFEVNIVEQNNYESRWDMISSNELGRYWANGSFFPERRKNNGEYSDHCSYAQDFVPLTPQELGTNRDVIRPPPSTDAQIEEEEGGGGGEEGGGDEDDDNATIAVGNGSGRRGDQSNRGGGGGQNAAQKRAGNGRRKNNKNGNNDGNSNGDGGDGPSENGDANSAVVESDDDDNGEKEEEGDNDDGGGDDDDGIQVKTGSKISISGGKKRAGKFTFDENNNISVSGGRRGKGSGPKINMSRQTNIKMRRRK